MERREVLKQLYKELENQAGVYQIKNKENQKILVISTPNLKSMNGRQFELEMGGYKNKELQKEWNQYGKDAFSFEVLEVLQKKEDGRYTGGYSDIKTALDKLEQKWIDKLQTFGERGYNKNK
jgi:hypothetical protein